MADEKEKFLDNLRNAIFECEAELAVEAATQFCELGENPLKALDTMTAAIKEVGDGFGRGDLWLPDLVGAADVMKAAIPILDKEIKTKGMQRESLGLVVAGTVYGDIHDMGKTILTTLLSAAGFEVEDLGVNVSAQQFIETIKKRNPDILAMSALLTTTIAEQGKVITALKENNLRDKVKVMVGGAAVSAEFAEEIGADGYDATAAAAVEHAKSLLGKQIGG
ncbi:MAG: cobalamin-dependent protein [Spirochaetota bacterium]|nr:MAG: cobalamin-dependent protein [Spirochaetota bacterium]